jgi:hypothetical protein
MLQLYGNSLSRAMRCMWMLEEMGLPYELIKKTTRPEDLQSAEYLRLNPNARIPTLVDGSVVIWESMAIISIWLRNTMVRCTARSRKCSPSRRNGVFGLCWGWKRSCWNC